VTCAADAPPLPPRQNRPSLVVLDAHVAGDLARRERLEPDRPAEIVDDERAA
jgi:hypothetical protein